MSKKVAVVVPTYNEAGNIGRVIEGCREVFRKNSIDGKIFVSDGDSSDGTQDVARKHLAAVIVSPGIRLGKSYVIGFGRAIKEGFDVIFTMDGDLSHDPKYIPDFLKKLEDCDAVVGDRYLQGGSAPGLPFHRKIVSAAANSFARLMFGFDIKDVTSGYRAYRREALEKIGYASLVSEGYDVELEILVKMARAGLRIGHVPIVFLKRGSGKTKLKPKEMANFIKRAVDLKLSA